MTTTLLYDVDLLPPGQISVDVIGAAIEGGRSLSGVTGSIDMSGGGLVRLEYSHIMVSTPQQTRYWNKLAAFLRGGVNKIIVPIMNDIAYPYPGDVKHNRPPTGGPFWIGPPFYAHDATRYQWFDATVSDAWAQNAGTIDIQTVDNRFDSVHRDKNPLTLEGGEWFGINHGETKEYRAHRITEIDSVVTLSADSPTRVWTVGISPPLRAAASDGKGLQFFRPRCIMGLPPDETMPWVASAGWYGEHSLSLIEKP
jgi:hypothetical protein